MAYAVIIVDSLFLFAGVFSIYMLFKYNKMLRSYTKACVCCGHHSTNTEFSPYMDDYCDPCTYARCDVITKENCPRNRS